MVGLVVVELATLTQLLGRGRLGKGTMVAQEHQIPILALVVVAVVLLDQMQTQQEEMAQMVAQGHQTLLLDRL
jgi:hypothetical protein